MKLIRKLKTQKDGNGTARRFGLFQCPVCNKTAKRHMYGHGKACSYKCRKLAIKHGEAGGKNRKRQRLYDCWKSMKSRCNYPKNIRYQYYGGKGIKVCDSWKYDYISFKTWALANGYKDNLTLDRIDSAEDYRPDNCQWITRAENSRKDNCKFTIDEAGEIRKIIKYGKYNKARIAKVYGVSNVTINNIANNKTYKEERCCC